MKLYVSKAEDRDQVIVILARNGYTVRQGKEKDPKNNKTVTFVEVIENGKQPSIRRQWPELALLHHIPNGGTRDAVEAKHLKQQGVKSGVPDLCLPVPRGRYHGLYIEMKTESGHTSDEQEWWGERLQAQGYVWRVCHGWQAAVAVLEWYLQL